MADYEHRATYPLAPANAYSRSHDAESDSEYSAELRRKKRMKYLLYFVLFVIFQTGVIAIFTLTIMKVRTPKFRVQSATFNNFNVGTQASPSFDISMNAQISIKNANFGTFKYQNTTMNFFYGGNPVGQAVIPKSSVGWRSNKKINVVVNLSSANLQTANSQLGTDLSNQILPLTSQADLSGKVTLTFIFKKKKATKMDCSMEIMTASRQLANIVCK
ncbi:hypothetical protein ACH5RR_019732 [Cinchona calisaya]|uniref:Late embryogenesis abundant protein LEA-2 subgroup domain-containing protein n=1 Tax=Cinchona calisaya TaxID=153742 RepID=A0ABD2ZVH7_9GENT